jgi:uncharacterized membrane protein
MNFDDLKYATFSFYGLSVLFDHLTTNIGINHYGLAESNAFTQLLIENGVWSYVDIATVMCLVLTTHLLIERSRSENKSALFFPLITGVIRLLTGIWNILLIL